MTLLIQTPAIHFSGSWSYGHADWLLDDEGVRYHGGRVHCLDANLSTRMRYWSTTTVLDRVSLRFKLQIANETWQTFSRPHYVDDVHLRCYPYIIRNHS